MKKFMCLLLTVTLILFAIPSDIRAMELTPDMDQMTTEDMLILTLTDEMFAQAMYTEIIKTYDLGVPFTWVVKVEANHVRFAEYLYRYYGLDVPEVDISDLMDVPDTYEACLELAIEGEIHNVVTYGIFLTYDLDEEVLNIFHMLQKTSDSHLKAFTRELNNLQGNHIRGNKKP